MIRPRYFMERQLTPKTSLPFREQVWINWRLLLKTPLMIIYSGAQKKANILKNLIPVNSTCVCLLNCIEKQP